MFTKGAVSWAATHMPPQGPYMLTLSAPIDSTNTNTFNTFMYVKCQSCPLY